MVIGNHDVSSDSELNANTLRTQSSVLTPRQESQENAPELEDVPIHDHIEEEIVLSGDEDDLVVIDTQTVDAAEDRDPEEDYFEHRAKQERPNLSGYDVPIGPFNSEEYEKNLGVDNQLSLFHKIPGVQTAQRALSASTHLAQSSVSNVTGSVVYTAQQTRQAGQCFTDSVLNAGQGVMVRVQESWATWPRVVNGGIQTISQFVMEGVQSLPPSDIIIRPQGRQIYG
ncbi:hypothetical protein FSST1_007575 [Fusarium sambucinum]